MVSFLLMWYISQTGKGWIGHTSTVGIMANKAGIRQEHQGLSTPYAFTSYQSKLFRCYLINCTFLFKNKKIIMPSFFTVWRVTLGGVCKELRVTDT